MKNSAIFSFVKVYDHNDSMVASVRITKWLQKHLEIDCLVDSNPSKEAAHFIENAPTHLDTLIIIGGAFSFTDPPILEGLARRVINAQRVVWVQNDYTVVPPKDTGEATSPFRRAFVIRRNEGKPPVTYWSTCQKTADLPGCSYVNWNMLTFDPNYNPSQFRKLRKTGATDTLLYYGSFRIKGREDAFRRYFSNPVVETVISCPMQRGENKFMPMFPKCLHVGKIKENFYGNLGSHGLGLYIEDKKSHTEFHSPANRFYEMLSAGLPMVFQPESAPMLEKADIHVKAYVAQDARGIEYFMKHREDMGEHQRQAWANSRAFRAELIDQVNKAMETLE